MKAQLYSVEGKPLKAVELPPQFSEAVRNELIKRAVLSEESKTYQPKGAYRWAGLETSARYKGRKDDFGSLKNRGQAKLPREVLPKGSTGKVKRIPSAVKGRRAHPPKPQKILVEQMNKKEYAKAMRSALAATAVAELVNARHKSELTVPIIIENDFEKLKKTKEVISALHALKLSTVLAKSKDGKKRCSGVRRRVGRVSYPKAALIVVSGGDILKSGRNIPGVDVVKVEELKVKHLAPGALPGRLAIFSESALEKIAKW